MDSDFPDREGITWAVGAKLEAQDETRKWYRAKIISVRTVDQCVMIHFDGWNTRWDSWFPMTSERLRPCSKIKDWRDKLKSDKKPFKLNERVLARWNGSCFYPATITAINDDGSYQVLFYDGVVNKHVVQSYLRHAKEKEITKIEADLNARQWLKPEVAEGRRARKPTKTNSDYISPELFIRRRSSSERKSSTDTPSTSTKSSSPSKPPSSDSTAPLTSTPISGDRPLRTPEKRPISSDTTPGGVIRKLKRKKMYLKRGGAIPESTNLSSLPTTSKPIGAEPDTDAPPTPIVVLDTQLTVSTPVSKPSTTSNQLNATPRSVLESSYAAFKESISKPGQSTSRSQSPAQSASKETPVQSPDSQSPDGAITIQPVTSQRASKSPRKMKAKVAPIHERMARVREVCHKWRKDKEKMKKKVIVARPAQSAPKKELLPSKILEEKSTALSDCIATPPKSMVTMTTSTPMLEGINTSPIVALERLNESIGVLESSTVSPVHHAATGGMAKVPVTKQAPKALIIDDDHNKYKCPYCVKDFRKENLLNYHLKYYHADAGPPPTPITPIVPGLEDLVLPESPCHKSGKKRIKDRDAKDSSFEEVIPKKRARTDSDDLSPKKRTKSEESPRPLKMVLKRRQKSSSTCLSDEGYSIEPSPRPLSSNPLLSTSDRRAKQISFEDANMNKDTPPEVKLEISDVISGDNSHMITDDEDIKCERLANDCTGQESIDVMVDELDTSASTLTLEPIIDQKQRQEVINCVCQLVEENGLMIQCEVCLCWQHAICIRLSEDKLPHKYMCWMCTNPPGRRDSCRFIHDQDWLKEGQLPKFAYLKKHEPPASADTMRRSPLLKAASCLVGDVHNVREVLSSIRRKIVVASVEDHPDLSIWYKNWDTVQSDQSTTLPDAESVQTTKEEPLNHDNDDAERINEIHQQVETFSSSSSLSKPSLPDHQITNITRSIPDDIMVDDQVTMETEVAMDTMTEDTMTDGMVRSRKENEIVDIGTVENKTVTIETKPTVDLEETVVNDPNADSGVVMETVANNDSVTSKEAITMESRASNTGESADYNQTSNVPMTPEEDIANVLLAMASVSNTSFLSDATIPSAKTDIDSAPLDVESLVNIANCSDTKEIINIVDSNIDNTTVTENTSRVPDDKNSIKKEKSINGRGLKINIGLKSTNGSRSKIEEISTVESAANVKPKSELDLTPAPPLPPASIKSENEKESSCVGSNLPCTSSASALSDHSYLPSSGQKNVLAYQHSLMPTQVRLEGSSVWTPVAKNCKPATSLVSDATYNSSTVSEVDASVESVELNPLSQCRYNLLLHIRSQQDLVDERLDDMEKQVQALEELDAGQPLDSDFDPLSDLSEAKKSIRSLIQDLCKVKRMATFNTSTGRRQ